MNRRFTAWTSKPHLMAVAVAACFASPAAWAAQAVLPAGGVVNSGLVSPFAYKDNTLTITSQSNASLNWQTFSIGPNGKVNFVQASAANAVLNRVVGTDPSMILGALQSNGRVFLINPNGILFGAGAQIDVAGLVASTLNLSNADFDAGRMRFIATPGAGSIVNRGAITAAPGGNVYLVAPNVENHGIITSPQGEVVLAAGKSVELVAAGTPNLRVQIDAPDNEALNVGQIIANSGRIGVYAGLIRNSGEIRADGVVTGAGGAILLKATRNITIDTGAALSANGNGAATGGSVALQAGDTTLVSGSIEATAAEGAGGSIQLLGNQVGVIERAVVNASGGSGGGSILIGGDYQGKNENIKNARAVYLGNEARVMADATRRGDGGKIILWSDEVTRALGTLSARGGLLGGNGGFVEVSGKQWLDFRANVDTSAPRGATGVLLLDPKDLDINDAGGATYNPGVNNLFANNSGGTSVILASGAGSVSAQVANVVLQASNDITFSSPVNIANAGTTLTAAAGRAININANVATNNADIKMLANETTANGVVGTDRTAGAGGINMAAGVTVSAGTGNIFFTVGTGAGHGGATTASDLVFENLSAANVSIINDNLNGGSKILRGSASSLISATGSVFMELEFANGAADSIGASGAPIRVSTPVIEAHSHNASGGIFIDSPNAGNLQIGGVPASIFSGLVRGVQAVSGGPVAITVNGNLTHFAGTAGCGLTGGTGGPICGKAAGGGITLSAANIGAFGNAMDVDAGSNLVSATASTGSIFLNQLSGNLLTSKYALSAAGAGQTLALTAAAGSITVDSTAGFSANTADDNFSLTATGGPIAFTGATTLTAASATLSTTSGITSGTAVADIDTSAVNGAVNLTANAGAIGSILNPLAVRTGTGLVSAATLGAGGLGDISIASPASLRVGTLSTAAGSTQTVTVSTTGGASDLTLTTSPVLNDTVTLSAGRDLDFNGQVLSTGAGTTATLAAGRDVLLRGGITETAGGLGVTVNATNGVRTGAGATFTLNGAGAGVTLLVNNAKVWNNDGTVNLQGVSTIRLPNVSGYARFSNNAGATFNTSSTAGWSFLSDSGIQGGILDNAGVFNVNNSTSWEAAFTNLATGTLNLASGKSISMQNGQALAGAVDLGAGATLWVSERHGTNAAFNNTTITGTGTVLVQAGAAPVAEFSSVNASGITLQVGAGGTANILAGSSTFGGLNVAAGTFRLNNATFVQAAGNLTVPTAGVYIGNTGFTATSGNLIFNGGTVVGGGTGITLAGAGSAKFNAGVVNLNMPITANLPVTVSGGTANFNGATNTFNNGGSVSTGTLNAGGATTIAAGLFDVTGGTFNAGGGTVNVNGTFHAGGGAISAGTMNVNAGGLLYGGGSITGNVINNGTVGPGNSPGTLTIIGNYTQGAGGTLAAELGGTTAGATYDVLNVTGTATLNGTLALSLFGAYTGTAGDLYTLINAGTVSGTFSSLAVPAGYVFTQNYLPGQLDVLLGTVGLAGTAGSSAGTGGFSNDLLSALDRSLIKTSRIDKKEQETDPDPDDFMCRE